MPEEPKEDAALVLQTVKVNGHSAWFSAYTDRLTIVESDGTREIPIRSVARISHRTGTRSKLVLDLHSGDALVIRGLKPRDTQRAYRILVQLASSAP